MDWKHLNREEFHARRTKKGVKNGDSERAEEDGNLSESGLPLWVKILLVGGFLGILVAVVVTYRSVNEGRRSVPDREVRAADFNFMEQATPDEVRRATEETVRGFMNAKSNAERCRYVIGGGKLQETMDEFYARFGTASTPLAFGKLESAEPGAFAGRTMILALATEPSGKRAWMYSLFPVGDGMKIDWETSVAYGEYSWPRFLREKPVEEVQMRVYLKRLPAYKMRRHSVVEYDGFELTAFGETQTAELFVKKNSVVAEEFARYVPAVAKQPMNLSLKWVDGLEGEKEIQVVRIIHNLWTDEQD